MAPYHEINGERAAELGSRSTLSRILTRLPLLFSFALLSCTWLAFTFTITIPEVLLRRHDTWHFIEQLLIFNILMGLTMLSLFTAATRSPGHPDPSAAPFAYVPEEIRQGPVTLAALPHAQEAPCRSSPSPLQLDQLEAERSGASSAHPAARTADPDDIPLRYLRNSQWVEGRIAKDHPSPLPLPSRRPMPPAPLQRNMRASSDGGDGHTPTISPFPLGLSPFVPSTAVEAGGESDWTDEEDVEEGGEDADATADRMQVIRTGETRARPKGYWMGDAVEGDREVMLDELEAEVATLLQNQNRQLLDSAADSKVLMAKSNTGGPRFCRKCESWKPDRTHHCRFCKRCVLKSKLSRSAPTETNAHVPSGPPLRMAGDLCRASELCVLICAQTATARADAADKPFLLFISYGTLLAIYVCLESAYQVYMFMTDDGAYDMPSPDLSSDGSPTTHTVEVEFSPLVYMLLAMIGAFFTLAIGGLATYHWYLVCNNMTTLEQISHTYPSALLPVRPAASDTGTTPLSTWKPDHLLTRAERHRLFDEARNINVYDIGWRKNILQVLVGDVSRSRRASKRSWAVALWPLAPSSNGDGHEFEYDETKLERLRRLTEDLRLGARSQGIDRQEEASSSAGEEE